MKDIIKIIKKHEQQDYKLGGNSLSPDMYNVVAKEIFTELIKPEIIAKEHFRKQRDEGLDECTEYTYQDNEESLGCANEPFRVKSEIYSDLIAELYTFAYEQAIKTGKVQQLIELDGKISDSEIIPIQPTYKFKTRVDSEGETFFLTDNEIKLWEKDGSFSKGDKLYKTIFIKEY